MSAEQEETCTGSDKLPKDLRLRPRGASGRQEALWKGCLSPDCPSTPTDGFQSKWFDVPKPRATDEAPQGVACCPAQTHGRTTDASATLGSASLNVTKTSFE